MRPWAGFALAALLAVAASAPLWLKLPVPKDTLVLAEATYTAQDGVPARVTLPHAQGRHRARGRYQLAFDLERPVEQPLYLFIPLVNYRALIALDGQAVLDTSVASLSIPGITLGVSALVPLPGRLAAGRHHVDVLLESPGISRGYLSAAYVGTAAQVAPYHRLRGLVYEHTRMMVLAWQLLLAFASLVAWFYRPQEPLYGWLFLLQAASTLSYAGLLRDVVPGLVFDWLPYAFMASMSSVFILHIIALMVNGARPPRWLQACVVAVPAACMLATALGLAPARIMVGAVTAPLVVLSPLVSVAIVAWGARKGVGEARLLLVPLGFYAAAALHDGAMVAGWVEGPVFLSLYYRQLLIVVIAFLLMRRLGMSLRRLDGANALLTRRLAEREAELGRLHAAERMEAARRARSEERDRLTVDLHDGLSGHLASIIALAERERAAGIERTAREALDDLRVVIHSMDVGDRELVAALSGLRERLERQLQRLGVALEWSMARLPEVSGVTPAHALGVLRIVQEAVTNALRHGPASRIAVRGGVDPQGDAVIVIENDGAPYAHGRRGGAGVDNMNRRAALLGGALDIEALAAGTRVTLQLPVVLPGGVATHGTESTTDGRHAPGRLRDGVFDAEC